MPSDRAHVANSEYQRLARDILLRRANHGALVPYSGDGINVDIVAGGVIRNFDVALKDPTGGIIVAECKRWRAPVKMTHVEAFAYRVELLRNELRVPVQGVYFVRTAYQLGAVKAAQFAGIEAAVCAQDQSKRVYALAVEGYDADREKRTRAGHVMINAGLMIRGDLGIVVARAECDPSM